MRHRWIPALALALLTPSAAHSFCGFYVASGDAKLFNHASQVVLVHDGDRAVLTMANDFRGDPQKFALVVPVPTVLEKSQIRVGDEGWVERLNAFSAPRLVEYFDPDPCPAARDAVAELESRKSSVGAPSALGFRGGRADGVRIEARYQIGEYDILILSATQSDGLARWLADNGYRVPPSAARVLEAYIKQGLKFFVARVNLSEQQKLGFKYLRPLQIAYESPRFMLPIRLGMANGEGSQELFVYAITRRGRVECTNYRNVKLPADAEIPEYVQKDFPRFYTAMFDRQNRTADGAVVFTEYAWDMSWCDPCAAPPLTREELRNLGVRWAGEADANGPVPQTFLTRLHVRYDRARFPEDLSFQETGDKTSFQGRFVVRHPWKGDADCEGGRQYRAGLAERRRKQAETLASLTGWPLDDIRTAMAVDGDWSQPADRMRWWERMWAK